MSELKEYHVAVPYSGYSRGTKVLAVTASSPEEALECAREYDYDHEVSMEATRDDTEMDFEYAELV